MPAQAQTDTAIVLDAGCGGLDGQTGSSVHLPAQQSIGGAVERRLPVADDTLDPHMGVPVGQLPGRGAELQVGQRALEQSHSDHYAKGRFTYGESAADAVTAVASAALS